MKIRNTPITTTLAVAILGTATPHAQIIDEARKRADAPADARIEIDIDGGDARADARHHGVGQPDGGVAKTHSWSKSISVTSDGKKTIRRTSTTRDGVTEEDSEVIDETGNPQNEGGAGAEKRTSGGCDGIGLEVKEADPALRDQLDLPPGEGVVVVSIDEQGPAAKAGIQRNDILLKAGDQVLAKDEDLRSELRNHEAGDSLAIEYLRKGQRGSATVTLGERGDSDDRQAEGEGQRENSIEVRINGKPMMDHLLDDPDLPDMLRKQLKELRDEMK